MKMMAENGEVRSCSVSECSYNEAEECWAPGITVGQDHTECDTFTTEYAQMSDHEASVLSCEASTCQYNVSESCIAAGVMLGTHQDHADCVTFQPS